MCNAIQLYHKNICNKIHKVVFKNQWLRININLKSFNKACFIFFNSMPRLTMTLSYFAFLNLFLQHKQLLCLHVPIISLKLISLLHFVILYILLKSKFFSYKFQQSKHAMKILSPIWFQ